nr:MAG TPA: hypothetical protein [Bacteriophage sp.]
MLLIYNALIWAFKALHCRSLTTKHRPNKRQQNEHNRAHMQTIARP